MIADHTTLCLTATDSCLNLVSSPVQDVDFSRKATKVTFDDDD